MAHAVTLFHAQHIDSNTEKPMSMWKICQFVSDEHYGKTGKRKVREADRKERNDTLKAEWTEDVRKWEVEKNRAKCERKKPRWTKPKMPTMEKAIIKPKVAEFIEESGEEEEIDEDEDECEDEEMGSSDGGDSD